MHEIQVMKANQHTVFYEYDSNTRTVQENNSLRMKVAK